MRAYKQLYATLPCSEDVLSEAGRDKTKPRVKKQAIYKWSTVDVDKEFRRISQRCERHPLFLNKALKLVRTNLTLE